jgi:crossover junction endodeoxyribonuclease RuvC
MRIVGIDPGLKATGYGFLDFADNKFKLIETGTIEPSPKAGIAHKLERIHSILDGLLRQYHPDVLVLEKLYAHHQHPTTASILGHARGIICLLAAQQGIELVEYSVKRIRKAITGNGNASKQQTQMAVAKALNVSWQKFSLDASDACALALGYCSIQGRHL